MGKRNRNNDFFSDRYWQSKAFNQETFTLYRNWIQQLALSRFKWINLPKTCDERYLERELFFNGQASIAFPNGQKGVFYSNKVVTEGIPNVYDNPSKWRAVGNNGWNFTASPKSGVIVYDNTLRLPPSTQMNLFARRLAAYDRTIDINLSQQHTPWILTCSQEQKNDLLQIFKQVSGGETVIMGSKGLKELTDEFNVLDLQVPYIGQDLQAGKQNLWSEIYTWLGIDSLPTKAERMIEEEVLSSNEPASLMALNPLMARREACKWINDHFGQYLDAPIDVVWRKDNGTDNYNVLSNIAVGNDIETVNGAAGGVEGA